MAVDLRKPNAEVRALKAHMRALWYLNILLGSLLICSIAFTIGYTNAVDRRSRHDTAAADRLSDRQWCDLLRTLDTAYNNPQPNQQPTTELGRRIAQAIHDLRNRFSC